MAKKSKPRPKRISRPLLPPRADFEATDERMAQAQGNTALDAGLIEKAGDKPPKCRRFRDSFADRQRGNGRFNYAQWYAAEWYRECFEEAGLTSRVVANYNPASASSSAGPRYGTASTERQVRARLLWRKARTVIPISILATVDLAILHDQVPTFRNGQQRIRYTAAIASGLQSLAEWLNPSYALDPQSVSVVSLATVD